MPSVGGSACSLSRVASVEPSSTMMISFFTGEAWIACNNSSRCAASLKTGTITDTAPLLQSLIVAGSCGSAGSREVMLMFGSVVLPGLSGLRRRRPLDQGTSPDRPGFRMDFPSAPLIRARSFASPENGSGQDGTHPETSDFLA